MAARAATLVTAPAPAVRHALNGRVLAVFPRLSALADRITVEPGVLDEARYVHAALAPHGIAPAVAVVGVEPSDAEIEEVRARAAAADAVILFLYDAHLYGSNRALLDALQASAVAGPALGVVLMRDPYDAEYLAPGVLGVTAYGRRREQLEAALARLAS
jgi:hypothetical protein